MTSNYFSQLAGRNTINENNNFISPQIPSWFGFKKHDEINPFKNIDESLQIDQPLLYPNSEENKVNPDFKTENGRLNEKNTFQSKQENKIKSLFNKEREPITIPLDNGLKPSDTNNNFIQINTKPAEKKNSDFIDIINKSELKSENNSKKEKLELNSESSKDKKSVIGGEKNSEVNQKNNLSIQKREIKIIEPLKVFRTELMAQRTFLNEVKEIEKIMKPYVQNVVELKPSISQKNIKIVENKRGPKLVIGKLTVEVIQAPKEKILIKEILPKQRTISTKPFKNNEKNSGLKVRFGLGQI